MAVAKLSTVEITFYFVVFIASVVYSFYHVYLAGKIIDHSTTDNDFADGWLGYKKDTANYEWSECLANAFYLYLPWVGCHIVLSEGTRWLRPQFVPAVSILITSLFLLVHMGPLYVLFAILQVVVYYVILKFKSVTLIWIWEISFLLLSQIILSGLWIFLDAEDTLYIISICWTSLRCTNFCLELLSSKNTEITVSQTFYDLLGYCFYFPTYFMGPLIMFSNFGPHMYRPFERWSTKRISTFLFNILRYLFWTAVTEASLYFLYTHALQYHMPIIIRLGEWTFYGLGMLIGVFFNLKYISIYGVCSTIAKFEGYDAPPPPKCVFRISLYTDMWRLFDVGFYQFLQKYIYVPLCAGRRDLLHRLMASAVCFSFTLIWQDLNMSVFMWCLLNFLSVSVELFGNTVSKSVTFKNLERRVLSETNSRRLTALLSAPLLIINVATSLYFFSGIEIGNIYFNQLFFHGTWKGLLTLLFVSYCICQTTLEVKNWEEMKTKEIKKN